MILAFALAPTLCLVPLFHVEGRKQEEEICEGDPVLGLLPVSPIPVAGPYSFLVSFRNRIKHNPKLLPSHQAHECLALACRRTLAKNGEQLVVELHPPTSSLSAFRRCTFAYLSTHSNPERVPKPLYKFRPPWTV